MGLSWDDRIRRAEELKNKYTVAGEVLEFYRSVAEYQKQLDERFDVQSIQGSSSDQSPARSYPWSSRAAPLAGSWQSHFESFLTFVKQVGTSHLAALAGRLLSEEDVRDGILESYWQGDLDAEPFREEAALLFFPKAFLQPYAERVALGGQRNSRVEAERWHVAQGGQAACPICGHPPQLGILRPEGEGARRSLFCSLCATEWRYKRVCCPACGEQDFSNLSYSRSEDFAHIRVDLCDSCKTYLKTIDLTVNGRAVPIVDEIAALPLDLWAVEQGYTKIELNLVGM